jgi:hypothetical protein
LQVRMKGSFTLWTMLDCEQHAQRNEGSVDFKIAVW